MICCPHYPLLEVMIRDGALSKPYSDAAAQDALDSPSVESVVDWEAHVRHRSGDVSCQSKCRLICPIPIQSDTADQSTIKDNRKMSSSEDELDSPTEMSMVEKINNLERFAVEQFSNLKKKSRNLQESMNDKMHSDMAAVKADLSALRSRVEAQGQQIGEIKRILEEKATSGPSHSEVQRKRSAPSPDWTPEQKRSRSEDLDQILQPFWPEKSDARKRLSERQQAFFNYMMDQLKVKDQRNIELNAARVIREGVSRGVWEEDWAPEGIKTSFQKYLEKKITRHLTDIMKTSYQQKETERLRKLVGE
ncbi:unnamed protein product [Leuciscus chuanchicus]